MNLILSTAIASLTGLLGVLGTTNEPLTPVQILSWQNTAIFQIPSQPEPEIANIVDNYIQKLVAMGMMGDRQEVYIQSDWAILADVKGNIPASAASLTKIATSLAVLEKWGANYQFETKMYHTGTINNGVINGDLIVIGGNDPLFVWEEAISLANFIQQKGIKEVKGDLIVSNNFIMNFKSNPLQSGNSLKIAFNAQNWSAIVLKQYQELPENTPKPELNIRGNVKVNNTLPSGAKLLVTHQSMTLAEILKQMNIYSNNVMAEMLAQTLGGGKKVAEMAAKSADFSPAEINLINGSGLGVENRISPRAACAMLLEIERKLLNSPLSVADIFPVSGRDKTGTMEGRNIPDGVALKTGTLNVVSALAGVIPTKERGQVWFAIINYGYQIPQFRKEQDQLLQQLSGHLTFTNPTIKSNPNPDFLGNIKRNI